MLQQLTISNYALINHTEISFDGGMSVITGETGAGKSIMLGALSLLTGGRADVRVLSDEEKKCVVEATFDISNYKLKPIFEEEDVDYEDITIIRREILPNGKSRAFVNDQPVALTFLKRISSNLIDIHSQHQNLLLNDDSFHLNVVDAVADSASILEKYSVVYGELCKLEKRENKLKQDNESAKKDFDYIQFQYTQLSDAKLVDGEEAELEQEQKLLSHAEEIKEALNYTIEAFNGDEAILSTLSNVGSKISKISDFLTDTDDALGRIESARIDLQDLLNSFEHINDTIEYDPERVAFVDGRLDTIYSLMKKHKVDSTHDLIALQNDFEQKLKAVTSFDEELEELHKQILAKRAEVQAVADELSAHRKSVFDKICSYIISQLRDMGIANAQFVVQHERTANFQPTGNDEIHFLFAANKNMQPTDIQGVASGGEMSRVMLAIKSLLSQSIGLPTIIFDEIDTGVSGEVADKMGRIMNEMATHMQVIAITHLPQVAAKGARHYNVYKVDNESRTVSNIVLLNREERLREIAKMLSGSVVSDAALQNAKELLEQSAE